jgi:membrane-associated phospholipid phosphatase
LRRPYAVIAMAATVGVAIITAIVVMHPFLPIDATVEDDIQSVNWGPLALTFPIFTWIGDAKGAIAEAIVFVAILVFNRRTWVTALGCSVSGLWYLTLSHIVIRARPTTAQVIHVTEHPGASSFPSGHTIFVVTLVTVLMLCFGHRFLPRKVLPIGWLIASVTVLACAISRIYSGAHWPTDVLASLFIAIAWLSLVVAVRRVSDPALQPRQEKEKARRQAAAG